MGVMFARPSIAAAAALFLFACSADEPASSTFEGESTPAAASANAETGASADTAATTSPSTSAARSPLPTAGLPNVELPIAIPAIGAECKVGIKVGKQTSLGCEINYDIDLEGAKDKLASNLPKLCADKPTIYNDCNGKPVEIGWKDGGDKAPKAAHIELGLSLFCINDVVGEALTTVKQVVSLNGSPSLDGFNAKLTSCSCDAPVNVQTIDLDVSALSTYKIGGENAFKLDGENKCIGFSPILTGGNVVARVVVTY